MAVASHIQTLEVIRREPLIRFPGVEPFDSFGLENGMFTTFRSVNAVDIFINGKFSGIGHFEQCIRAHEDESRAFEFKVFG